MDKEKILNDLRVAVNSGLISKNEVTSAIGLPKIDNANSGNSIIRRFGVSEILYFIGGIIVLIGLIILVAQNWMTMSYGTRVLATFGTGVAFFLGSLALSKTNTLGKLDNVFYILSAILTSFGYFVMFEKFITEANMNLFTILIPFLLLLQFGLTQFFTKKDVFTLFNAVFGTWLFFSITNVMISNSINRFGQNFDLYRVILVGFSYLSFGYFLQIRQRPFSSFFDIFGILGVLGASFALNVMTGSSIFGGSSTAPAIWSGLFPLILLATLFGSVYLKKSAFLFIGMLFLVAYLIRITAQYFSNITGWPIALIFIGIVIIGLGYLAIYINKKYIKSATI
jgi:hypothetical protein